MTFVSTQPPKYDCEIFNEVNVNLNSKEDDATFNENSEIDYADKYLVFVTLVFLYI